jgi:predicted N-formylglutamate amidohydrolase
MSARIGHVVVTCEHATNRVPPELSSVFRGHRALLKTHRGWDIGALGVAERVAAGLASPLFVGEVSRLVIELNRSPDSSSLFSVATRELDDDVKRGLVERYYTPWRGAVRKHVELAFRAQRGAVVHVSAHSFTPELDGKERSVEIGLLFDPSRAGEKTVCERWREAIVRDHDAAGMRVRMNLPYRGTSDGHTTALRRVFPASRYVGIEVEVRNDLIARERGQERVGEMLARTLRSVMSG